MNWALAIPTDGRCLLGYALALAVLFAGIVMIIRARRHKAPWWDKTSIKNFDWRKAKNNERTPRSGDGQ